MNATDRYLAPDVTVAMPARNVEPYIGQAIESALAQTGIRIEIIVVDDASTDATADVVRSLQDERIKLLHNNSHRGIAFSHNRIVKESRAPIISHLDTDDFITHPDALRMLVDRIQEDDRLGQVHGYFTYVHADGSANIARSERVLAMQRRTRVPGRDYRHALIFEGAVMNALRTYRKQALLDIGPFCEDLTTGVDYEMALRMVDRWKIDVLPQPILAMREHPGRTTRMRFQVPRQVLLRLKLLKSLEKSGKVAYLKEYPGARRQIMAAQLRSLLGF